MSDLTIYHNPRCSKSRQTLELIRGQGVEPEIVLYLEDVPAAEDYGKWSGRSFHVPYFSIGKPDELDA